MFFPIIIQKHMPHLSALTLWPDFFQKSKSIFKKKKKNYRLFSFTVWVKQYTNQMSDKC